MVMPDIPVLVPRDNWQYLNAARIDIGGEFAARIPQATKGRQIRSMESLQMWTPGKNEFAKWLANKVGTTYAHSVSWDNELREFKSPHMPYGDTYEETSLDLIRAKAADPNREVMEKTLFGTHKVPGQSAYHTINRMDRYDITIPDNYLNRAFTEEGGVGNLVTEFMNVPTTSDNYDEFIQTTALFSEYESNGGFFKIHLPDIETLDSNAEEAKKALRVLRATAGNLKVLSTKYNAARQYKAAKASELVIFATPEFMAAVDVEALAGAFNADKMEMMGRIITVPKEYFGIEGMQAIMTTKDFFVIKDTLFQTSSQRNEATLATNHFLHHQGIISASPFVPAIMFWTGRGDEEAIVVDLPVSVTTPVVTDRENAVVTDVERAEYYNVSANAVMDSGKDGEIYWSLEGRQDWGTSLSQEGVLYVSGVETATTLVVTAHATKKDPKDLMKDPPKASFTVNVIGEYTNRWPVANTDTAPKVSNILVEDSEGVQEVVPAFDPATLAYTIATTGWTGSPDSVTIAGVDNGDVVVTVAEDKGSFTVYAPGAPGDPTYTVTVTDTP